MPYDLLNAIHSSGIDPVDLPNIFDAFHRGTGTEKEEGPGVGLAAVKAIVESHGGRIRLKYEQGYLRT